MKILLKRTDSANQDFQLLIGELDFFLDERDKKAHTVCKQYNATDLIKHVIVAYNEEGKAIGCGALREYASGTMELKRMYVRKNERRKNIASLLLVELENWAKELNSHKCILETGNSMLEAINMYKKNNYKEIPNYGQYESIESSICFEKNLTTY